MSHRTLHVADDGVAPRGQLRNGGTQPFLHRALPILIDRRQLHVHMGVCHLGLGGGWVFRWACPLGVIAVGVVLNDHNTTPSPPPSEWSVGGTLGHFPTMAPIPTPAPSPDSMFMGLSKS